tara:strand:+ start:59 stop:517 length:459 start_codon:yes stop_codon:yes gene_type:complete
MPSGIYIRTKKVISPYKGINKYGIKLKDFDSYKDYKIALKRLRNNAYFKGKKGKFSKSKYFNKYSKSKGRIVMKTHGAKRRAYKLQRTPKWANFETIKQFYLNCPKGYHVDHIIPLQGKNVSGLHILNNLQYLTKTQNLSKGNKFLILNQQQ